MQWGAAGRLPHGPLGPALQAVWSKNSCSFACVVFEEPPKPFATLHRAVTFCVLADRRKEQHVPLTLMIPLVMKMLSVLR